MQVEHTFTVETFEPLRAHHHEEELELVQPGEPCFVCGQETRFRFRRSLVPACICHALHYTVKQKPPQPEQRRAIASELEDTDRDRFLDSDAYRSHRRDLTERHDPILEYRLLVQALEPDRAIRALARWLGARLHHSRVFPEVPRPLRDIWPLDEVLQSGLYVFPDRGHHVAVVRPLADGFPDAVQRLVKRLRPAALSFRLYPWDDFDHLVESGYKKIQRHIDLIRDTHTPEPAAAPTDEPLAYHRHVIDTSIRAENWAQTIDLILAEAFQSRVSDVHIKPIVVDARGEVLDRPVTAIYFRKDGYLRRFLCIDHPAALGEMLNRLKAMAQLRVERYLEPVVGSFTLVVDNQTVFCRLILTPLGEAGGQAYDYAVVRLLDSKIIYRDPEELGYYGPGANLFFRIAEQMARGIIIIAGETGSGKSTSLHLLLRRLHRKWPHLNYISAEQPVEYRQDFVTQIEIDEHHRTFPVITRALVRMDPDIILIGEIRDIETAQAAFQMGISGHLVLTTIHALHIADIFSRLSSFGVDTVNMISGLSGLLTQTLVRRPCPACRERRPLADIAWESLLDLAQKAGFRLPATVLEGAGCPECQYTGHQGRIPVIECARVEAAMWEVIKSAHQPPLDEVIEAALQDGYVSLVHDALEKVNRGDVSGSEFNHVLSVSRAILKIMAAIRQQEARQRG